MSRYASLSLFCLAMAFEAIDEVMIKYLIILHTCFAREESER